MFRSSWAAMVDAALFSSDRMDWGTPEPFFARLDREFGFTLDPCALPETAKCATYYTPEIDGLAQPWPGRVFVNPPYGREIGAWVRKAYQEAQAGATVVMLIPARTDTAYWHKWVMRSSELRFVRGRLRFEGADNSAPFPSCVVIFRPGCEGPPELRAMLASDPAGDTGHLDGDGDDPRRGQEGDQGEPCLLRERGNGGVSAVQLRLGMEG